MSAVLEYPQKHRRCSFIVAAFFLGACGQVVPPRQAEAPQKVAPPEVPEAPAKVVAPPKADAAPRVVPAPPAAKPPPPPPAPRPPPPPPAPRPPPLDLASLESRLKDTGAIGVLTKLSLKNQVDDLIDRFLAFHDGKRPPTLSELRPAYELLLMKVLSLLQDKDAALARDINASREAIWSLLTDRQKLARYK